jgi:hypothetical protein
MKILTNFKKTAENIVNLRTLFVNFPQPLYQFNTNQHAKNKYFRAQLKECSSKQEVEKDKTNFQERVAGL